MHDRDSWPCAIGCFTCPYFRDCGGLNIDAQIFDCLHFCCGGDPGCTRVCRNNQWFVDQYWEVDGFELDDLPRGPVHLHAIPCDIIPMIYHGGNRRGPCAADAICLRLADLVDFRAGAARFETRRDLADQFKIREDTHILLSGVDHDTRVERWWALEDRRIGIIRQFKKLGIELVTTPNFSMVLDRPRTDDIHAIKRIGIVFAELIAGGLATALHVNGRTDRDFERWGDFIREREEVGVLSYEFITGPGRKDRRRQHIGWLGALARAAGRPLDIVIRGDPDLIPQLRKNFRRVIYVETTSFMKTVVRKRALRQGNANLLWPSFPTARQAPLDGLLEHNQREAAEQLTLRFYDLFAEPIAAE